MEFETQADDFFTRPQDSVHRWERAADAPRLVSAIDKLLAHSPQTAISP
jgi:hypothetical protein